MASTYSDLKFELIGTGDQSGTWGSTTNDNIGTAIEQAITGFGNPIFTTDANLTITLTNTVALQTARALVLNATSSGSLTATRELVVPTIEKQYIVQNNTTGGQSITVKTTAGTGITVPNGKKMHLYVDGTNVVDAVSHFSSLTLASALPVLSGGTGVTTSTGTGNVVLSTSPTLVTPALGTPSALVGTNITGTAAAFNINGTVGATTPAAGAFTTLSATGVTTVQAGTAALPAITTTGDTNTGIYFPAADTIAFTEGGAEAMRLDSSGNVLINTTTAVSGSKLVVASADLTVHGLTVGRGGGAVATNTAFGTSALAANQAGGTNNTAIGNAALDANTTGDANTAVGDDALGANTTASNNTAVGYQAGYTGVTAAGVTAIGSTALYTNTAGFTTAVGYQALNANTSATFNDAFGASTLLVNTTGANNSAFGRAALTANTTGASNVGIGATSLLSNTTGSFNTALGNDALRFNTTASNNTAVGYQAGYSNTTGATNVFVGRHSFYSNTTASNNTGVGHEAGYSNTTGTSNTALGQQALRSNTTAASNTAVGAIAGTAITTGPYNTVVGYYAGAALTTGAGNTFVGSFQSGGTAGAGSAVTTGSKNVILGGYTGSASPISATGSNYIVLSDGDGNIRAHWDNSGNPVLATGTSAAFNGNSGSYTVTINGQNTAGANAVLSLTCPGSNSGTLTYIRSTSLLQAQNGGSGGVTLASSGTAWVAVSDERQKENLVPIADAVTKVSNLRSVTGNYIADPDKKSKAFLIAQDVEAVFPEAVDKSDPDVLGLAYTDVIPLLVAAIKEQTVLINSLKARLDAANF